MTAYVVIFTILKIFPKTEKSFTILKIFPKVKKFSEYAANLLVVGIRYVMRK